MATWCEEPTHWKRSWCWERLRAGREGGDRGWDGWMASLTQRTWVWVNSGSWWWTGRCDVLQSMGSQRVGHDWGTELNWPEVCHSFPSYYFRCIVLNFSFCVAFVYFFLLLWKSRFLITNKNCFILNIIIESICLHCPIVEVHEILSFKWKSLRITIASRIVSHRRNAHLILLNDVKFTSAGLYHSAFPPAI